MYWISASLLKRDDDLHWTSTLKSPFLRGLSDAETMPAS